MLVSGMAASRGSVVLKVFGLSVSFTFLCFGFSPEKAISTSWPTAPGIKISYQLNNANGKNSLLLILVHVPGRSFIGVVKAHPHA